MGNILSGPMMVFFIIILNAMVAFVIVGATPAASGVGCDSDGNTTTCEGGSPASFLDTFFDVSIGDIGAPAIINGMYLLITGGILVLGFALIVAGIIGTPLGAG